MIDISDVGSLIHIRAHVCSPHAFVTCPSGELLPWPDPPSSAPSTNSPYPFLGLLIRSLITERKKSKKNRHINTNKGILFENIWLQHRRKNCESRGFCTLTSNWVSTKFNLVYDGKKTISKRKKNKCSNSRTISKGGISINSCGINHCGQ